MTLLDHYTFMKLPKKTSVLIRNHACSLVEIQQATWNLMLIGIACSSFITY